jgi:hypothetical protein
VPGQIPVPRSSLGLLFLLGSLAAGPEQTQSAGEHLTGHALNDGNNVARVERLLLVADLFLLDKEQALALDFDVIVLLLSGTLSKTATSADATFTSVVVVAITADLACASSGSGARVSDVFALLLLLLLALLSPDLVNIEELDGDQISLEGTVTVFAAANEDVGIKQAILGRDIGIAPVLLVHAKNARDKLPIAKESREGRLRQVGCEKSLALLLLLLLGLLGRQLGSVLAGLEAGHVLTIHGRNLESLQLVQLHGVELLPSVEPGNHHLAGELHQLGLTRVLKGAETGDGLMAERATGAMAGLERGSLTLAGTTRLILALALALGAPVAVKVAGGSASVASAAAAARELASKAATAVCANSHALAPTVTTPTTAESRCGREFRCGLLSAGCAFGLVLRLLGGARSARSRKLEAGRSALLLGNLGGLLGVGQSQGVPSLMAASSAATAPSSTAAGVLPPLSL